MLLIPTVFSTARPFLAHLPCVPAPSEEVFAVARVVWSEARNQPEEGQRMIVQVIKNRAAKYKETILETVRHGMVSKGRLDPKIVELVEDEMGKDVGSRYCHWIRLDKATDKKWVEYAKKQDGVTIGSHFFF